MGNDREAKVGKVKEKDGKARATRAVTFENVRYLIRIMR
jgi:hypothetical protein